MSTKDKIDVAAMARQSRNEYTGDEITLADTPAEPFSLFAEWLADAMQRQDIKDGNAMCLSTVDKSSQPHSRMVLLKDVEYGEHSKQQGFVFYTNYEGNKAKEMLASPKLALNFWWPPVYRQVRVEGIVTKLGAAAAAEYFATRARGSQIGAWASPQSSQISDYEELTARVADIEERFSGKDVPLPPHWGGYIVSPTLVEFWQGSPNRLHRRIVYRQQAASSHWDKLMLAP